MTTWVMVMMGGALGTGARYGLSLVLQPPGTSGFPLGTLTVNLVGCLLIGVLAALMPDSSQFSTSTRLGLMVGVLGGFTTFSSFGLESIRMIQAGQWTSALTYVVLSNLGGLLAVWVGLRSAQ
jgi:CrcB protein